MQGYEPEFPFDKSREFVFFLLFMNNNNNIVHIDDEMSDGWKCTTVMNDAMNENDSKDILKVGYERQSRFEYMARLGWVICMIGLHSPTN